MRAMGFDSGVGIVEEENDLVTLKVLLFWICRT